MNVRLSLLIVAGSLGGLFLFDALRLSAKDKDALQLTLRSRPKDKDGRFPITTKEVSWQPKKTALIICDMWDDHWCESAARRVGEMTGPLNDVVKALRTVVGECRGHRQKGEACKGKRREMDQRTGHVSSKLFRQAKLFMAAIMSSLDGDGNVRTVSEP